MALSRLAVLIRNVLELVVRYPESTLFFIPIARRPQAVEANE